MADDIVNVEGEEEPDFQNAGGGQARQRANRQSSAVRERPESSARGRQSGTRESTGRANAQGIGSRASRQESERQKKVASIRPEGKRPRGQGGRRAS